MYYYAWLTGNPSLTTNNINLLKLLRTFHSFTGDCLLAACNNVPYFSDEKTTPLWKSSQEVCRKKIEKGLCVFLEMLMGVTPDLPFCLTGVPTVLLGLWRGRALILSICAYSSQRATSQRTMSLVFVMQFYRGDDVIHAQQMVSLNQVTCIRKYTSYIVYSLFLALLKTKDNA